MHLIIGRQQIKCKRGYILAYPPPKTEKRQTPKTQNSPFTISHSCDIISRRWGISAVGSAPQWHCGGQEFESLMLHHLRTLILIRCQRPFICPKTPRNKGFPAIRLFQMEVPVAGFFCLSLVATRVFLHDSLWFPCKFTRFWPGNVYLYTILPSSV